MGQRRRKRKGNRKKRLMRRLVRLVSVSLMMALLGITLVVAIVFYRRLEVFGVRTLTQEDYAAQRNYLEQEGYPESLIELLEKNPETKDFVFHYYENKDKHPVIDLTEEVEQGTIPLFLQWDERWGYETYGSDFLAVTGCGPTCLSMVWCGMSGETKWNPLEVSKMAENQGFYVDGAGSSWSLMTEGAEMLGLSASEVIFEADNIVSLLKQGIPIICIMRAGDFTTSGHFIVLVGVDDNGEVIVCDPNSRINSEKTWEIQDLMPQIKNLWSYEYHI